MKKRNLLKMITISALTSTMIISNCGMYSTMCVYAQENDVIENEDINTDDVETTTNTLNISSLDATIQAYVDDNEIFGTEENDVYTYEVETGKTVYFTVTSTNDGTIKVTRMNNETGCDEEMAPEEDGRYKVEINNDECITVTSTKEEEPDEEPDEDPVEEPEEEPEQQDSEDYSSAHITTQTITSDDSGYQWEDPTIQSKSEEEMDEYAQEAIDQQNRAATVTVDGVENPYANESDKTKTKKGLESLVQTLVNGDVSSSVGYISDNIYDMIFQQDQKDEMTIVQESLNDINNKSDRIIKQLNQMESRLEQIQKGLSNIKEEQKIQNIRADLNVVTTYRVKLETFVKTMKALDKNNKGDQREVGFYKDALRRLDTTTLNNVMDYGNALLTKGTNTNQNSFYVLSTLISCDAFGWEPVMKDVQFYQEAELVAPYMEAVTYIIALKRYSLSKLEKGSTEYNATLNDIELIQKQVNEINKQMKANELKERESNVIVFYMAPGDPVYMTNKLRFQTNENKQLAYDSGMISNYENRKPTESLSFMEFILGKELQPVPNSSLLTIHPDVQKVIANNLATIDHDGLVGTQILADIGFNIKYYTDTLTFITSYDMEKKTEGNKKYLGVHTLTLTADNKLKSGVTYFRYTDANGNIEKTAECDTNAFVSFMMDPNTQSNKAAYCVKKSSYNRKNTVA